MLAPAGLLLLQISHDFGLDLGFVWLALQEFQDQMRDARGGACLVGVHVGVTHDGLRRAGVGVGVLGLDGPAGEVAVGLVALQAAVRRHGHADGGRDEGAPVVVCGRQGSVARR